MKTAPKLGILAGGGAAPRQLIKACQDLGRPYFVVCLEGNADKDLGEGVPHAVMSIGHIQSFKDICEKEGLEEIVMIGRVRRPSLTELHPDMLTLKILAKIGFGTLGDDGLLRAVGKALEEECGVKLVGAGDVFADLLTPEGVLTKAAPDLQSEDDIRRAVEIALELGKLDVGQAVIVQQGMVLGVESIEGTDALIARARDVKREGGGGVLVKLAKPQQDNRFDLPAIGPDTVQNVRQAGLTGIAVEAGRSLIIEKDMTLEAANASNIFIVGLPTPKVEKP